MDPRVDKMGENLVNFSVSLKKGEKLLIECYDEGHPLVQSLIHHAHKIGAHPFVWLKTQAIMREILLGATQEYIEVLAKSESDFMDKMDAYIGFRGYRNFSDLSDVPAEKMLLYQKYWWKSVHIDRRIKHTKWCVLRWPSIGMAQQAKMSTEAFEDFYFQVCGLDYGKMDAAAAKLVALMNRTDRVRIVSPKTDLKFSIKGIGAVACTGRMNIPDGEVYTAPVRDSIEGVLTYNTPSPYNGMVHEGVQLTFEKGKIVGAQSNFTEDLNKIFDTDEGARYVGEFALGFNPYIRDPFGEILFDEKIDGSLHFTPGNAYDDAFNGNQSSVHWDMVLIQRPEYGGGEIYFDDIIVRKDGVFVHKDLLGLNPENLISHKGDL